MEPAKAFINLDVKSQSVPEDFVMSPIHEAAKKGYTEQIEESLSDEPKGYLKKDTLGNTPLHWAASGGHYDAVAYLIKLGSDVNAENIFGDTPLHRAAWKNHKQVAYRIF
jgi:ankyrin repeat protein